MLTFQHHVSLKPYTTFAVDVHADFFVEITTEEELFELISTDVFATQPRQILGGGANILFTKDFHGLVIKVSLMGKKVIQEKDNLVYISFGAGENRHESIMRALEQGYVGGENLVFIPGQIGSAPVGNIGAYGREAKDLIYEVEGIDLISKEKKLRTNSECQFGYRDSVFKHALKDKVIITAVTLVFHKHSADYIPHIQYQDIQAAITQVHQDPLHISAKEVADIIIAIRKQKLPDRTKIGTAGSFFKNPIIDKNQYEKLLLDYPLLKGNELPNAQVKLSAGQLIDLAGYKGKQDGAVGTYANHALIIVNHGGASGADIRAFAQAIQKKVLDLFGVMLEPEVIIL